MSAQYDVIAGLDISSLSSVTQSQLMQMVNQLAPLANIGGVIFQAGTSLNSTIAQGTGGSPDVTNNPRFARYLWLNTYSAASAAPTPYYYDASTGDWTLVSVTAGSIGNAQINAAANIAITKLAAGTARYLIRTNAAGTAIEYVAPADVYNSNELAVNKLVAGGSNGYLKTSSGSVVWVDDTTERAAIQNAIANLAVTKLAAGANNTLLGTNGSGTIAFDTIGNILANGAIGLSLLAAGGAAAGDILKYSGSAWVKATPSIDFLSGSSLNTGYNFGAISTLTSGSAGVTRVAHGFSSPPKILKGYIKNTSGGNATTVGHPANTIIPIEYILYNSGNDPQYFCLQADNTYVALATRDRTVDPKILYYDGSAYGALTRSEWTIYVYAWF